MRYSRGVRRTQYRFESLSPAETQRIAEALATYLGPGDVVACIGELGTGKTCFLQGLLRGLGASEPATSPTFVLINEYHARLPVYHVDAYRTESLTEILDLGIEEMLRGEGVTVIEWAEKLLPLLPGHSLVVRLSGLGDEPREIIVEGPAERLARMRLSTLTRDGGRVTQSRAGEDGGASGADHQLAEGGASPGAVLREGSRGPG